MTKDQLESKIKSLEEQLKTTEINFHRISGAIALLKELIAEENKVLVTPPTPEISPV